MDMELLSVPGRGVWVDGSRLGGLGTYWVLVFWVWVQGFRALGFQVWDFVGFSVET